MNKKVNIWIDFYKSLSNIEIQSRINIISKSKYVFQKQNQLNALNQLNHEKSARTRRKNQTA